MNINLKSLFLSIQLQQREPHLTLTDFALQISYWKSFLCGQNRLNSCNVNTAVECVQRLRFKATGKHVHILDEHKTYRVKLEKCIICSRYENFLLTRYVTFLNSHLGWTTWLHKLIFCTDLQKALSLPSVCSLKTCTVQFLK